MPSSRILNKALLDEVVTAEEAASPGKHTPHLLDEAFAWHRNLLRTGSMRTS